MVAQVTNRLASGFLTLMVILTLIFVLIRLIPGDPAEVLLGAYGTAEQVAALRHELGLDETILVQYAKFLAGVAQGEFGYSIRSHQLVVKEIARVLPYTIQLTAVGVLISLLWGVPFGVVAAYKRNSLIDTIGMIMALAAYSAPSFWLALLLLIAFSIHLNWFPTVGGGVPGDWLSLAHHLVLPALALGLRHAGLIARITRSCMLEVLGEDYIRSARAKGLAERAVLWRHALKNTAIPIVTVVGLDIGVLLGGSVALEVVFTRPGMGRLLVDAVLSRDYSIVQGLVVVWALIVILVNLIVDVTYTSFDPRVRCR